MATRATGYMPKRRKPEYNKTFSDRITGVTDKGTRQKVMRARAMVASTQAERAALNSKGEKFTQIGGKGGSDRRPGISILRSPRGFEVQAGAGRVHVGAGINYATGRGGIDVSVGRRTKKAKKIGGIGRAVKAGARAIRRKR